MEKIERLKYIHQFKWNSNQKVYTVAECSENDYVWQIKLIFFLDIQAMIVCLTSRTHKHVNIPLQ